MNEVIKDFIYLHYLTNRKDTEFWRQFNKNKLLPSYNKFCEELIEGSFIPTYFSAGSYAEVAAGLKNAGMPYPYTNFNVKRKFEYMKHVFGIDKYEFYKNQKYNNRVQLSNKCVNHDFVLKYIRDTYTDVTHS